MPIINTNAKMINLYYSSESKLGKKVYAYLNDSDKELLAIDVTKTNVTGTQWKDISEKLNIHLKDLVDISESDINLDDVDTANYSQDDWIKILNKTPKVLNHPIVIHNNTYYQIKDAQEALKFIENPSRGIDERKRQ
jgi:arsenate reductase-like glutaredoxin family protein